MTEQAYRKTQLTARLPRDDPPRSSYLELAGGFTSRLAGLGDLQVSMATRVADDLFVVLQSASAADHLEPRSPLPVYTWSDSLCYRMWVNQAPRLSADVSDEAPYADAPLAHRLGVRTYVGAPVVTPSGRFVGSLCGVSTEAMSAQRRTDIGSYLTALVQAQADLLGMEFERELARANATRERDWDDASANLDPVTLLPGRSGWRLLIDREDGRGDVLAEPLGVIVVDVHGVESTSDVARAAIALSELSATQVRIARIGPTRFGLLCQSWSSRGVSRLREAVHGQLDRAGLPASIGTAMRRPHGAAGDSCRDRKGLWRCGAESAWHRAEQGISTVR